MKDEILLDFYSRKIIEMKDELLKTSRYIAADAYFSKSKFIHSLVNGAFIWFPDFGTMQTYSICLSENPKKEEEDQRNMKGKSTSKI